MHQYIKILRPLNCLMAATAVLIGAMIASEIFLTVNVFLASLIAFLVAGAGFVINDYYDFEIDKINNPTRPLPSGKMSLKAAYIYAISLFFTGIVISILTRINLAISIVLLNSALLYLYARNIKRRGGIEKNLIVSYLVASPFFFGGVVAGNYIVTLFFVLCAALVNTGREIIKDIEDYKGDRKYTKTLPIILGIENSAKLSAAFILTAILCSFLPYYLKLLNLFYLIIIIIADLFFLLVLGTFLLDISIKNAGKTQRLIKVGMGIGLLAFFIGSL